MNEMIMNGFTPSCGIAMMISSVLVLHKQCSTPASFYAHGKVKAWSRGRARPRFRARARASQARARLRARERIRARARARGFRARTRAMVNTIIQ